MVLPPQEWRRLTKHRNCPPITRLLATVLSPYETPPISRHLLMTKHLAKPVGEAAAARIRGQGWGECARCAFINEGEPPFLDTFFSRWFLPSVARMLYEESDAPKGVRKRDARGWRTDGPSALWRPDACAVTRSSCDAAR